MLKPKVSVIIPVYNSEKEIPVCLETILNQTYPPDLYEIIVVDNNSTDGTAKIVKSQPVKYAFEKRQSSYAARNKGIQLASGELLVFTDADCLPAKNWLSEYIECYSKTGKKLIGGAINITAEDPNNSWMMYDKLNHMNQKLLVTTKNFAATANLMVHKEVFEKVGSFDSGLVSGGDSEFGRRATKKFDMVYCPKARIYHPARGSFRGMIKKKYRLGFGFAQRNFKEKSEPLPVGDMFRGVIPAIGYLNPDFKILRLTTDYDVPNSSKMKMNLFFIDFIGKFAQFLGELRGRKIND
jgi:glycosyltransferase involved in cell wall biosynthesis